MFSSLTDNVFVSCLSCSSLGLHHSTQYALAKSQTIAGMYSRSLDINNDYCDKANHELDLVSTL